MDTTKEFNLEEFKEAAIVQLHNLKTYNDIVRKNCDTALEVMRGVDSEEAFNEAIQRWPEIGNGFMFIPPTESKN